MTGLLNKIGGFLTDDTNQARLMGFGNMLMQMDKGQAPDTSWLQTVQGMEQQQQFRDSLGGEDMMSRFTDEERSFLAGLPPQVAQKLIAERMFGKEDSFTLSPGQTRHDAAGNIIAQSAFPPGGGLGGDPTVQSSTMLDDGTSVMVMRDGSRKVISPTGDELTGQEAADAIKAARDYTVANQRDIYAGRREGTLGADIGLGAAAAGATEAGRQAIQMGREAYEDVGRVRESLSNIDEAIAAIDAGAQSGMMAKHLPNVTEASARLNNAANRMGLDIIGATTFGALSEGEMAFALDTAMPRDLSPPELRNWLLRKRDAQERAMITLMDAASFLSIPGNTLGMWIERNEAGGPAQLAAPVAPAAADPAPGPQEVTGQAQGGLAVGHTEGGYRYIGGNPSDPASWEQVR